MTPAMIQLKDGTVYRGESVGAEGTITCEIVTNTSMSGYGLLMTDPAMYNKAILFTYPEIGQIGMSDADVVSPLHCAAVVARVISNKHVGGQTTLTDYCKQHGIMAIQGIDTRTLTQHIHSLGEGLCIITTDASQISTTDVPETIETSIPDALSHAMYSVGEPSHEVLCGDSNVAVIDLGITKGFADTLATLGINADVYAHDAAIDDAFIAKYSGFIVAGGLVTPDLAPQSLIDGLKKLLGSGKPVIGFECGHNALGLAADIGSLKQKSGHRGGNYPVRVPLRNKTYITTQNHGYVFNADKVEQHCKVIAVNHNDNTIEAVRYNDVATSWQYTPDMLRAGQLYVWQEFISALSH